MDGKPMMNFVERYGAMSDGELEQIAESMDDLTDEAKQALRS
jgi:hypothetical protein